MANNLIRVQRGKETRIVQRGLIPPGFTVVAETADAPKVTPPKEHPSTETTDEDLIAEAQGK